MSTVQPVCDELLDAAPMPVSQGCSVTVICPMYNEQALIEENVTRLLAVLHRLERPWQLVLINDGSTDETLSRVKALCESDGRIRLVSYRRNRGRGYALRQGFAHAEGDLVVATESDLSYGEDVIVRLVEALESDELDAVVASPYCRGGALKSVPFIRAFYSRMGNRILRLLVRGNLTTYTGMTRGYRREVIQSLDLESDGKELHLEIISKLRGLGYRIGEIPATLTWPAARRQRTGRFKPWPLIASHLFFGIDEGSLVILTLLGLLLLAAGTGTGLHLLALSISGLPVAARPLLQFSALLIVVGLVVLLFGLLARQNKRLERQLHRIQRELRSRNSARPGENVHERI